MLLRPVRIGNVLLGKSPVIVLTVADREAPAQIRKAGRLDARVLELRIDRLRKISPDAVLKRIRLLRKLGRPLIATIRSSREGGGRLISDPQRLELFKKILPEVQAIDLELSSPWLVKALVPTARRKGKQVLLSYHNFKSTPSDSVLLQLVRKAKHEKADLVKLAVTPKKPGDIARLLLFTQRHRKANLVTIAMGKRGAVSRVLAPLFGSLLAYTYAGAGRPQAPGQLPLRRLSKELKRFSRLAARSSV